LEVGTETIVDKSKSTKTVLMDLFPDTHTDIEGATIINACYGGTAALLNACLWVESDSNHPEERPYAIVVAADIATYARGPARPTSGCGAVAMLIGRNAPLVIDMATRTTHASNTWDFYKPDPNTEYPTVDGAHSQNCYYRALEDVYMRFADKINHQWQKQQQQQTSSSDSYFHAEMPDFYCFHAPYNKLVQKSYARLFLCDAKREGKQQQQQQNDTAASSLLLAEEKKNNHEEQGEDHTNHKHINGIPQEYLQKNMEETYNDKTLEGILRDISSQAYQQKFADANHASKYIGNTYTASVFFGIASLVQRRWKDLKPNETQIAVFSYGSGALATMYRIQVREPQLPSSQNHHHHPFTIEKMAHILDITNRLNQRQVIDACELDHALETRARMHRAGAPYSPVYPPHRLWPGTYHLVNIDTHFRRTYARVPKDATYPPKQITTLSSDTPRTLAPPIVLRLAQRDAVSHPVTGKLQVLSSEDTTDHITEARRRIACVITGTAAGLPGIAHPFQPDNLKWLIEGRQCITHIPESSIQELYDKNVVQNIKSSKDCNIVERVPVGTDVIRLAAQLGEFDLTTSYGVTEGLAKTMDLAAQVAVAAGLEALKNAGLVRGRSNNPEEWKLPEQYRDTTGVVYASSFPAMDAAVGEVMRFLQSKTNDSKHLIAMLRERLGAEISPQDEVALQHLETIAEKEDARRNNTYEFDRKFLFRVLVLGNAQLAQLAGCRGPNTQTNAACAGTTQAIAMAQDMLISGRAQRVIVVAGDNASGSTLLPWLGSGFRALGAACTKDAVEDAAMPFDKRRSGLLLGAGGIGMVLETEESQIERQNLLPFPFQVKARLLHTQYSNSAYHGAALDRKHIASELTRFLNEVEIVHGICKAEIATHGVYFSHETSTHASPASSCAGNEIAALRQAFGDDLLSKLKICNTKGFTGHPMGVSFEDVTAVEVLMRQQIPPVPNHLEQDDYLGELNLSKGGHYACRYALRFAAGFGSQVAFALYATAQFE
jgi:hydroxymethylglutaryl-CoA synthase